MNNMRKLNADFMLLIVAIIWGTGFIATEYAINANMSPIIIMAFRFNIAAIILLFFNIKTISSISKAEWIKGIIAGTFLFLGFFFQTFGQSMTTVSNSAFITATNVVIVPFIVWALTKKKPKNKLFFLALLTFIGIVILTVSPSGGVSLNLGDFLVLIGAFMFAFHISYISIAVSTTKPKHLTFIQLLAAAIFSLIGLLFIDTPSFFEMNITTALPAVIFLGVFSTCICFFMQTSAQKRTSASKTGIILSTESFFGTLFSILLGIELISLKIVIGGIIILFSVIMTEINVDFKKLFYPKKSNN